jgi:molecular chaperone DnaK (HSP70)
MISLDMDKNKLSEEKLDDQILARVMKEAGDTARYSTRKTQKIHERKLKQALEKAVAKLRDELK